MYYRTYIFKVHFLDPPYYTSRQRIEDFGRGSGVGILLPAIRSCIKSVVGNFFAKNSFACMRSTNLLLMQFKELFRNTNVRKTK